MNTNFEDRLRSDLQRFTRDVRVPAGLAQQAYRHNRKRRRTLRVAVASGAATAVAASAVAIAGLAGAFGSAQAVLATQTTAYVLKHVESALAPASVDNLIDLDRIVFPPGNTLEPVVGGLSGGTGTSSTGSPWSVASMLISAYRGAEKYSAYSPSGQHVFDIGISVANGSGTQTTVIYRTSNWWTAVEPGQPGSSSAGCAQGSIDLTGGPGSGWPAFIRSQLSCGAFAVAGHQVVGGIDAIKITGGSGRLTLFVNPATYLPVQLSIGPLQMHFQWLSPTPANLAQLKVSVPAGFQQVPPPTQS